MRPSREHLSSREMVNFVLRERERERDETGEHPSPSAAASSGERRGNEMK